MTTFVISRPSGINPSGMGGNFNITIPANSTLVVDSINSLSAKWFYTLVDSVNTKSCSGEILGMHRFNSNPTYNITGMIGDIMPHQFQVLVSGSNLELELTNPNNNAITIYFVRVQIV